MMGAALGFAGVGMLFCAFVEVLIGGDEDVVAGSSQVA